MRVRIPRLPPWGSCQRSAISGQPSARGNKRAGSSPKSRSGGSKPRPSREGDSVAVTRCRPSVAASWLGDFGLTPKAIRSHRFAVQRDQISIIRNPEGPPEWSRAPVGNRLGVKAPCGFDSRPFCWGESGQPSAISIQPGAAANILSSLCCLAES